MFSFRLRKENNEYESLSNAPKESFFQEYSKPIFYFTSIICIALLIFFGGSFQSKPHIYRATVDSTDGKPARQSAYTIKARAQFDAFGITGYVDINEGGFVDVNVNVSEMSINSMNTICGENNLEYHYHLHNEWNHDDMETKFGPTHCGADYTAGHYNPFGVPVCGDLASNEEISYYNCEVGDFSGRFGIGIPDIEDLIIRGGAIKGGGGNRIMPEIAYRRSLVFHCSNGIRLFCAPFEISIEYVK